MTELSVILCTLLPHDEIECLEPLERSEFDDYEVIVRRDPGLSKARNEGIKEASTDKLVFIDDDAIPQGEYLATASRLLDEHPIVGGRIIHPNRDIVSNFSGRYDQGDREKQTDTITGCNMAFRREVFEEVGYFDENLEWGHEESDLVKRARRRFPVVYSPELVVTHAYADSVIDYWKKMYRYGPADVYFYRKHGMSTPQLLARTLTPPLPLQNTPSAAFVAFVGGLIRSVGRLNALTADAL